jgi:hypothetical protein
MFRDNLHALERAIKCTSVRLRMRESCCASEKNSVKEQKQQNKEREKRRESKKDKERGRREERNLASNSEADRPRACERVSKLRKWTKSEQERARASKSE